MISYWEYCEVGWTTKHITIHVYSRQLDGSYEGVLEGKEWGSLLAQLGADGWEMVGVVPAKPAGHTLYYFKRPLDPPEVIEMKKQEKIEAEWERRKAEQERIKKREEQKKAASGMILQSHQDSTTNSASKAGEPVEQLPDSESKTENPDQAAPSDSSLRTEHKPEP